VLLLVGISAKWRLADARGRRCPTRRPHPHPHAGGRGDGHNATGARSAPRASRRSSSPASRPAAAGGDPAGRLGARAEDAGRHGNVRFVRPASQLRPSAADDVARADRAIADGLLDYSTGQAIDVDGGLHLRSL